MNKQWYVYMIQCSDGSLYTGITIDLERRVREHNEGKKGAKAVKGKRPVKLVYFERCEDSSSARKREYAIKQWKKEYKLKLVERFRIMYSDNSL